ncbi:MAG: hypothetical protein HY048_06045 [Acidobacteria bacterium]|nr:hypothetical protein [Acidobacteriota bacterium]
MSRIFLLSPADCRGRRAQQILSARSTHPLAAALRSRQGAPLGELFTFISALYFRGKLTYARRFAQPPDPDDPCAGAGVHVITPTAGLRTPDTLVTRAAFLAFADGAVESDNPRYTKPLAASARALRAAVGPDCDAVLLGSIASPKYVDVLTEVFAERLCFPVAFVGRGDMSRGGLLLRQASAGAELEYGPMIGAVRHGPRPPRLPAR